ncbi:putative GNAT family N-acyltransferase [Cytobacillus eiseniae]|uniref:GNAT family N-acyltransferase n=1 Tax=Cytobacillus eiseniae TaxID=762947 RepID=A0ABS4RHT5_9BACI|nr:GNAT family N-acetyltransferase [Cytobacillus eiseniae]MBP2242469.1 putative GNAT family N-acyltransferase [Cytobacillus eiseniae]
MIEVRRINPEMTYPLRHSVLRPYQQVEDCMYDTDHQDGAFHVGAFYQEQLISVASFCIERNPDFPAEEQYRLRGMATLPLFRKLGAGREIVTYAEKIIAEIGTRILWCKARTTVQDYYTKIGFYPHGEVFDYPPIGPHIIMFKNTKKNRL